MSGGGRMVIQYHTGKTDIVLVKVPEKTHSHKLTFRKGITRGKPYGYWHIDYQFDESESYTHGGFVLFYKDLGGKKNYPKEGCLALVGNPFELIEEKKRDIVPQMKDTGYPFEFQDVNDTFDDMLNHLKVYRVNPFNPPIERLQYGGGYSMRESEVTEYNEAEERTGPYILLTAVKA